MNRENSVISFCEALQRDTCNKTWILEHPSSHFNWVEARQTHTTSMPDIGELIEDEQIQNLINDHLHINRV